MARPDLPTVSPMKRIFIYLASGLQCRLRPTRLALRAAGPSLHRFAASWTGHWPVPPRLLLSIGASVLPAPQRACASRGMRKEENPTAGVWHHLFEPVYTGGHPIRALGDLGTQRVRPTHHASIGLPNK